MDILSGGILGSLFGGVFRLIPEVLKWLDKKSDREHELAMFNAQCDLEKLRGAQKLSEIGAQTAGAIDQGMVGVFQAAMQQQTDMVKAAGGWVASLSASVRPIITYWIFGLWTIVNVYLCLDAYEQGMKVIDCAKMVMSPDFMALVSGTLNYWFLDRTLAKRGL